MLEMNVLITKGPLLFGGPQAAAGGSVEHRARGEGENDQERRKGRPNHEKNHQSIAGHSFVVYLECCLQKSCTKSTEKVWSNKEQGHARGQRSSFLHASVLTRTVQRWSLEASFTDPDCYNDPTAPAEH